MHSMWEISILFSQFFRKSDTKNNLLKKSYSELMLPQITVEYNRNSKE